MSHWITLVLVIHMLITVALVAVILLQRSEGGGLGIGGGGGGGLMSALGAANLLSRATAILATLFIANSILLAIMAGYDRHGGSQVEELLNRQPIETPSDAPAEPVVPDAAEVPAADALPALPVPEPAPPLPVAPTAPAPAQ